MQLAPSRAFQAVLEADDPFLALWPHRFDFLYAEHPDPEDRPDWKTESRHPLSDRLLQEGAYLYGVRFGKQTHYLMLDIDHGSLYHPHRDRFAIPRLLAALEPLGLVETVAVTSSYRGGLHLYLPFQTAQETWAIAQTVATLLANAGFKLKPGQLELFPNPKPFSEAPSLYAAHRLPLQAGSYLLNSDWQPIYGEQTTFVQRWQFAQQRNTIDPRTLKRVLQQAKRQRYKLSGKAEKFLHDLTTEVLTGWTDAGQTNYLLGRIAMREYIFGHVQRGSEPLTGEALVDAICEVARALPGFETYCSHQADLEQRAILYARSIQTSRYYPFGSKHRAKTAPTPEAVSAPTPPNQNQQKSQAARDRICQAVTDLLTKHALPTAVTARKQAIRAYGIGNPTLDKYKALWHPNHLKALPVGQDHTLEQTLTVPDDLKALPVGQDHTLENNKLVPIPAALSGQADGSSVVGGSGGFSTVPVTELTPVQAMRAEQHLAKMQVWLESGDPILVVEAQQYFAAQVPNEQGCLSRGEAVEPEQLVSGPMSGVTMPGGFGRSQPQSYRGVKTALQAVPQPYVVPQQPVQEPEANLTMQAEVEAFFAQYHQEQPESLALAWSAGVYNPLAGMESTHARALTVAETDWLGLARLVGWLLLEDELDAIYFTAPPRDFALEQADWYVRADVTTFLEEPERLSQVVQQYPISEASLRAAIAEKVAALEWTPEQLEQLIQALFAQPGSALE
ncbi:MAG: hypothetical protein KME42_08665 [Tildeniella nuda ZEHNDER 1965/U140]|jgi:hypothetical protein|nr:hypothetical protein [Tildeniella nuda ZEHNDER 1965/U140]